MLDGSLFLGGRPLPRATFFSGFAAGTAVAVAVAVATAVAVAVAGAGGVVEASLAPTAAVDEATGLRPRMDFVVGDVVGVLRVEDLLAGGLGAGSRTLTFPLRGGIVERFLVG